ncbi:SIS domain-containing protein [Aliiglaciecola sp. LCG003]|uniref:SIS domain-containing protein n=1 Tax=Aliiglaciecola sp. LCG003 TaxID=3053655 RepID=UPI0025746588|nr:SIS domain-containing protein [Aliiglaciecola sp. LCG003]WJG10586.1 SIS domain-containing protein [Aliiglaciecola sp. LCG003]
MKSLIASYQAALCEQLTLLDTDTIERLAQHLLDCCMNKKNVYICGNGGSAGNAIHLANDYLYGIDPTGNHSLNVEALPANSSVLTCLGNDIGYERIFSHQLTVKAKPDDVLIVLSGSGNSNNIIQALKQAKEIGMISYAILGYSGGKAKTLADHSIHNDITDMQISEDLQLIVGHMLMQYMAKELAA